MVKLKVMKLKNLILILIFLTFTLINLGGHVHNTGSSLACPDWPLCHDQLMPEMTGGVLIEHSHRLLATLVGFLTLLIIIKVKKGTKEAKVSYLAFAMVIVQGLLGGLTVIYKLPPFVSMAHLGLSMIFFCTIIYFHHLLCDSEKIEGPPLLKNILTLTLVMLYLQILLGAFIRHKGFGTVCGLGYTHSVLCGGRLFPESLGENIHMLHRFLGLITALSLSSLSIFMIKINKQKFFILPALSVLIILGQVALGVMTVGSGIRPGITMFHLGGAALSLALLWKIQLKLSSN